jgi:hypothetical protein
LLHSLTHLAIGVAAGLALYRSFSGAKAYALALGIAYAGLLFLLGMFSRPVGTLGGILPLNAPDDILHILTALVAFGAYSPPGAGTTSTSEGSPRPGEGEAGPTPAAETAVVGVPSSSFPFSSPAAPGMPGAGWSGRGAVLRAGEPVHGFLRDLGRDHMRPIKLPVAHLVA